MPETPFPPAAELFDEYLIFEGRISVALTELKRRVEISLPLLIDEVNTRHALAGAWQIEPPKGYHIAPESLADKHINSVLFGASVEKETQGTQLFRNKVSLLVYIVNGRITDSLQVAQAYDRAQLVNAVLAPYLKGCRDESNRVVWVRLKPKELTMLPESWAKYSGVALPFELVQSPEHDLWTAP